MEEFMNEHFDACDFEPIDVFDNSSSMLTSENDNNIIEQPQSHHLGQPAVTDLVTDSVTSVGIAKEEEGAFAMTVYDNKERSIIFDVLGHDTRNHDDDMHQPLTHEMAGEQLNDHSFITTPLINCVSRSDPKVLKPVVPKSMKTKRKRQNFNRKHGGIHNDNVVEWEKSEECITTPLIMQNYKVVLNNNNYDDDGSTTRNQPMKPPDEAKKVETQQIVDENLPSFNYTRRAAATVLSTTIDPFLSLGSKFESHGKDVFPPKEELSHFVKKGYEMDEYGFYPIHKACIKYPQNAKLIGTMIRSLPKSSRFQVNLIERSRKRKLKSLSSSRIDNEISQNLIFFNGMYPVHIAIANAASLEVIKLLVRAEPSVLSIPDSNGMVALSLAFRFYHKLSKIDAEYFNDIVTLVLAANISAVNVCDIRMNTPLHYACMTLSRNSGSEMKNGIILTEKNRKIISFTLLQRLVEANTSAIHQRNLNGNTPLELAESTGNFDDECISYLQRIAYNDEDVEEAPDISLYELAESTGNFDDGCISCLQRITSYDEDVEESPDISL